MNYNNKGNQLVLVLALAFILIIGYALLNVKKAGEMDPTTTGDAATSISPSADISPSHVPSPTVSPTPLHSVQPTATPGD